MPTLFRFLVTSASSPAIVYGAMFALVTFVEPRKGEMTVRVPLDKLNQVTRHEERGPRSRPSSK